jgi:hypothetical protein
MSGKRQEPVRRFDAQISPMSNYGFSTLALLACIAAPAGHAATLPGNTTLPVLFTHTIHANKAKVGDKVTAKTMQVVLLPNGDQLPRGTEVTGHIVEASAFHFDDTPYAKQRPSNLAIQIDTVQNTPVSATIRAMANVIDVEEAITPHGIDETDHPGTVTMVGGAHYSPVGKQVIEGPEEDIVAYNKKQGVFAHLLSGNGCSATDTEQSVGIFSPDACGLYGFANVHLTENDGTFRLSSTHAAVTLYSGTAALLQIK